MRIYTPAGDIPYEFMTFPDGQPHVILGTQAIMEDRWHGVTIEASITSCNDLVRILLTRDVLAASGFTSVDLDIRYLLGARMDRRISIQEPATLDVIARLINSGGFGRVRILDAHSERATTLLRATNVLPYKPVGRLLPQFDAVVAPDKGATDRVEKLAGAYPTIFCEKKRDPTTGRLSDFSIINPTGDVKGKRLLIIDDICDGGGTFVGLAKVLRVAGASSVNLYVTHGIFSRELPLDGIDYIYTTDSREQHLSYESSVNYVSIFPISMKEL
jgi:ribose-phosphate pyrophosphokinase